MVLQHSVLHNMVHIRCVAMHGRSAFLFLNSQYVSLPACRMQPVVRMDDHAVESCKSCKTARLLPRREEVDILADIRLDVHVKKVRR